jgi:predicted phosphoribosyltransferase
MRADVSPDTATPASGAGEEVAMDRVPCFEDRGEAGRCLAVEVGRRFGIPSAVAAVSAPGGCVAFSIARAFARPLLFAYCAPLSLPEAAGGGDFGAIDEQGHAVLDYAALAGSRIGNGDIDDARRRGGEEIARFYASGPYRRLLDVLPVPRVLLVDDGLAPAGRMEAALALMRRCGVSRVIVAAVCAATGSAAWFCGETDGFVALTIDDAPIDAHFRTPVAAPAVGARPGPIFHDVRPSDHA